MRRVQEIVVEIDGMRSRDDELAVIAALAKVSGVVSATASASEGLAVVTADAAAATPELLRSAVERAGFTPGELRFPE